MWRLRSIMLGEKIMSYLKNDITKYINAEKEKFFNLDTESDYGNLIDFEMQCKKEWRFGLVRF